MLRLATNNDFDFIFRLYMHPQVNRYLLYEQMSKDEFLPVFNDLLQKNVLLIYEKNNLMIGMCKLVPQQFRNLHIVYLGGVAIHPDLAGKGEGINMMTEIIDHVKQKKFSRIELSVATENKKAIHLYEKAGFQKEGILKKFTYLKSENKYLDEVMMALLL